LATTRSRQAPRPDKRTYGEGSRELILEAARKLFARRGLHETSMSDIADEARVSRATVFNQFGSRHLVLDAITARTLEGYCDLLDRAVLDESSPTPDLVRRLFSEMGRRLEANRALYREIFGEIRKISMGLEAEGESPVLRRKAFDLLVGIFRRGQARGELARAQSPEVFATAFDSLLAGAITQWLKQRQKAPLQPLLAAFAEVFLAGVVTRD